jgi:broad specificity phosphatase PhoE
MANRIHLVRHGQTEWAASGRHTGKSEIPLDAAGEAQAKALRALLGATAFEKVLTSPLARARRTASLAGFPDAEVTPLLHEVDYGEDEGKTRAQIQGERPGWDFFDQGPKNGESLEAAAARAGALLNRLRDVDGDVLLFSHGHFLRILTTTYLGVDRRLGRQLLIRPASLCVLGHEHEWPNIELWDQTVSI